MSILTLGLLLLSANPHAAPAASAAVHLRQDVAARLQALQAEYSKTESDFFRRLQELGDGPEARKLLEQNPLPAFLERFRELAYEGAGTETGATAWSKVFDLGLRNARGEEAREALEVLLADHLDSPQLRPLAGNLPYAATFLGAERVRAALETLHAKAAALPVRAEAQFSLASMLMASSEAADKTRGRELLEDMLTRYAGADEDWGARAKGMLFELDHLQVGMLAPDFEAVDVDGAKWKLSDYKGKVVIVDFWGFW
jgi:hypothetical protein